ncbi:MAG: hypothetical protein NC084_08655 [Bacteroides sp.]|nr:hypothetical protein [Eubacterium sp.]MCM1418214.1 hypothetical protein [Roseburia sp.]MCM1462765.1 hypothetical protein [Bacteroides sp.]
MGNGTMSAAAKLSLALAALAAVFLALSVVSANLSVSRTVNAIGAIGTVEFSDQSKEKIDLALTYYAELDPNLALESKITNADELSAAKFEYVRLAIKKAYLADKNGDEKAAEYTAEAREIFDEYCSTGECKAIANYDDLTALEEKYSAGTSDNSTASNTPAPAEEIELC